MKNVIAIIVVWAVLLGFLATGVKVMATSPTPAPGIQTGTVETQDIQRVDLNRSSGDGEVLLRGSEL